MLALVWSVAVIGATWILAWHVGTHAAILGAVVMTFAALGMLIIYSILARTQDRQKL